MTAMTRLLATLFAVLVFAAGCGDDDTADVIAGDHDAPTVVDPDTPVDDGDTPVSSEPGDTDAPADPGDAGSGWQRIEPTDDLVNPIVSAIDELVVDPDDPSAVLVRFFGGVPECYGARATVVEQSADVVRIRLEVGTRADIPADTACIEIAVSQELRVELDAPLGDRTLEADTTDGRSGSDPAEPGDPNHGEGDATAGDPGDGDSAVSDPNPGDGGGTPVDDGGQGLLDPGAGGWQRIEPTADLMNPGVAVPDELVADPADPSAVLVRFYGGVPECYGARATVVEQSGDVVRIRLEVGGRTDAGDIACIQIAVAQELRVELDAPLGDRTVRAARR
jgi:hypothetical protein